MAADKMAAQRWQKVGCQSIRIRFVVVDKIHCEAISRLVVLIAEWRDVQKMMHC